MVLSEFTIEVLVAGLAGGMLGAAIGALPSLSIAGLVITIGEIANASQIRLLGSSGNSSGSPDVFGVAAAPLEALGATGALGFGPVFGPHVAFAGGVAAAAFLGRRETFDTTFRYHQAKKITKPLGSAPEVLLVGGAFGVLGVGIARLAVGAEVPVDPIALAIVASGLIHRLTLGYSVLGRIRGMERSILDMSPFENDERWGEEAYETKQGIAGRQVVEVWLPDHYEWDNVAVLGAAVGIVSGYIALVSGSAFLAFGIATFALAFLCVGLFSFPVVYHMALPASIAALAVDAGEPIIALIVAGVFGILGALLGELAQRTLYAHADTHLDPGFVSILLTSILIGLLATAGVFEPDLIPYPTI